MTVAPTRDGGTAGTLASNTRRNTSMHVFCHLERPFQVAWTNSHWTPTIEQFNWPKIWFHNRQQPTEQLNDWTFHKWTKTNWTMIVLTIYSIEHGIIEQWKRANSLKFLILSNVEFGYKKDTSLDDAEACQGSILIWHLQRASLKSRLIEFYSINQ